MQIWWLFVAEEKREKERAASHREHLAGPEEDEYFDQAVYDLTMFGADG